jgi:hypothetical protein
MNEEKQLQYITKLLKLLNRNKRSTKLPQKRYKNRNDLLQPCIMKIHAFPTKKNIAGKKIFKLKKNTQKTPAKVRQYYDKTYLQKLKRTAKERLNTPHEKLSHFTSEFPPLKLAPRNTIQLNKKTRKLIKSLQQALKVSRTKVNEKGATHYENASANIPVWSSIVIPELRKNITEKQTPYNSERNLQKWRRLRTLRRATKKENIEKKKKLMKKLIFSILTK